MVEIKDIGIILVMIVGFTTIIVTDDYGIVLEPTHYCEDRELKMYCDHLSSTNITCYPSKLPKGYKRCSSLWQEIPVIKEDFGSSLIQCDNKGCWSI